MFVSCQIKNLNKESQKKEKIINADTWKINIILGINLMNIFNVYVKHSNLNKMYK